MKFSRAAAIGTVFFCASLPLAALAQPIDLTPQLGTDHEAGVPRKVESVEQVETTHVNDKGETVTKTETTTTVQQVGEGVAITPVPDTQTHNDFIAFASEHCRAFIGEGKGNLGFALSKRAAAKFSEAERAEFNREFARKLIHQYQIDASKPCVLNTVSMKPVVRTTHEPKTRERHEIPTAKHEIAVVNGQLATTMPDVTVSVAYRLERIGASPWVLTNITFNGQPLVDRYRVEYDALANRGGSQAILDSLK